MNSRIAGSIGGQRSEKMVPVASTPLSHRKVSSIIRWLSGAEATGCGAEATDSWVIKIDPLILPFDGPLNACI